MAIPALISEEDQVVHLLKNASRGDEEKIDEITVVFLL
jgi:hypothetical protein